MQKHQLALDQEYICNDSGLMAQLQEILDLPENKVIVIKSPQGTGKSFLLNELAAAITMPTRLLADQHGESYGCRVLIGDKPTKFFDHEKQVSTFKSSRSLCFDHTNYFAIDEAHKLVEYADFAIDAVMNVFDTIDRAILETKKILLVSATPEKIVEYINLCQRDYITINCFIDIKKKDLKPFINTLYVYPNSRKVHYNFSKNIIANKESGRQAAIFRSKPAVRDYSESLDRKGLNVLSLTADDKESKLFDDIVTSGMFEEELLLSTSLIDCGINLYSLDLSNLYNVWDNNIAMHLQFCARARYCTPNYHLQLSTLNEEEQELVSLSDLEILHYHLGDNNLLEDIPYSLEAFSKLTQLRDKEKMLTIEGVKEIFKDTYIDIDISSLERKQPHISRRTLKQQSQETLELNREILTAYLRTFVGQRLSKPERDNIIAFLTKHGSQYKNFKPAVEQFGFSVRSSNPYMYLLEG